MFKINLLKTTILSLSLATTLFAQCTDSSKTKCENTELTPAELELKYINSVLPNSKVSKYERAEIDGLYKVFFDNGQMYYVHPFKKLIFFGEIWNSRGYSYTKNDVMNWQKELTQKNVLDKYTPSDFKQFNKKVTYGKGSNKYEFAIFTDPECPYCKNAEKHFSKGNVDLYVIYKPLPFHKNARNWARKALSSSDFQKAFDDIRAGNIPEIELTKESETLVNKMEEFADKLNVTGTPKIIVMDKKSNKVVDVINGANTKHIDKYLNQNK